MKLDFKSVSSQDILKLRHEVLRKGKALATAHFEGDEAPSSQHFACFHKNKIVGCISFMQNSHKVLEDKNSFQLRGMAVDERFRGKGVGKQLLDYAETKMFANDTRLIWCNVRTTAEIFYSKSNYKRIGDVFDVPDVGPHVLMYKTI